MNKEHTGNKQVTNESKCYPSKENIRSKIVEEMRAKLREYKKMDYFYGYTALGSYELAIKDVSILLTKEDNEV